LRQILTNLISNAVKFTEKGFVKVGVRMVSQPKAGTPVQLEFTVADSGIGVSAEMREKLFRPFAQAEASTTRRYGGTGLGLHLSKQLAHALGGDLSLQTSKVGHGSTFVFTVSAGTFEGDLVVDGKGGANLSVPAPAEKPDGREVFEGKKVLLIEDSEDNQTLIKHYLNAVGIQVEVANNGFDGLAKMASAPYDLVVLDIQMPGMDGHQVARSMRDRGFSQPIIALTAHAFKEDREKAFRNGFNEYLTKPINRIVLLKTLSNRLGSPALH
jgi:CheY-like chemotaxis protein